MASRGMIMIRQQAVTETSYILNDKLIDTVDLEYRVRKKITGANAHKLKGLLATLIGWCCIIQRDGTMPDKYIDLAIERYNELTRLV